MKPRTMLVLCLPALVAWACSSTTANKASPSTGGAAGTAGAAGAAGQGGTGGSGIPTLKEVRVIPGGPGHQVSDVAIGPTNGHVFVLGYGSVASVEHGFLAELAPGQGGELLPRRDFTSTGAAYAEGVTVAGNGAIFLSGFFVKDIQIGNKPFLEPAGWGGVLARILPGAGGDQVDGISIVGSGNQSFWGNARLGSASVTVGAVLDGTSLHGETVKTDAAGDAIVSIDFDGQPQGKHVAFGGSGAQRFFDVATDSALRIYAAGETPSIGAPLQVLGSTGALQLATVVCYDSTLHLEWARALGSGGDDAFFDVAADASGKQVAAVGQARGQIDVGTGPPLPNAGGEDVLVAQFDSAGTLKWARTFGGGADDRAYAVAIHSSGDIFVGGNIKSASIDFGTGQLTKQGSDDGFLLRLDADGNVRFATLFGGTGNDSIGALTAAEGRVVAVGKFQGKVDLLGKTFSPVSPDTTFADIAILELAP